jgi:hypothetical protein
VVKARKEEGLGLGSLMSKNISKLSNGYGG